jgi:leucyl/phenylalanyl-tRNA--protein transferase
MLILGIIALVVICLQTFTISLSKRYFPWFGRRTHYMVVTNPRMVLEELVVTKACETSLIEIYLQSLSIKILEVISNCQQIKRDGQNGTWITNDMIEAYCNLHLNCKIR